MSVWVISTCLSVTRRLVYRPEWWAWLCLIFSADFEAAHRCQCDCRILMRMSWSGWLEGFRLLTLLIGEHLDLFCWFYRIVARTTQICMPFFSVKELETFAVRISGASGNSDMSLLYPSFKVSVYLSVMPLDQRWSSVHCRRRKSTVYKAGYSDTIDCPVIRWFWQVLLTIIPLLSALPFGKSLSSFMSYFTVKPTCYALVDLESISLIWRQEYDLRSYDLFYVSLDEIYLSKKK